MSEESLKWAEARVKSLEDAGAFGAGQLFQAATIFQAKVAALEAENEAAMRETERLKAESEKDRKFYEQQLKGALDDRDWQLEARITAEQQRDSAIKDKLELVAATNSVLLGSLMVGHQCGIGPCSLCSAQSNLRAVLAKFKVKEAGG